MTPLITKSDFANKVLISAYVREELLNTHINNAQKFYLQAIIGDAYYNDLVAAFEIGAMTVGQEELLEQAKDMLVYRAGAYYYAMSGIQDTQSGLRTHIDNYSEQLTPEQLRVILRQTEVQAVAAESKFKKWLAENKHLYPEIAKPYTTQSSGLPFAAIPASKEKRDRARQNRPAK